MANQKELPEELIMAIESGKLEKVSGGKILHVKKGEKDTWFVAPDLETINSNPLGAVKMKKHGNFSGPYYTAEEAIEAAKKSGCLSTDVVEWDEYKKRFEH